MINTLNNALIKAIYLAKLDLHAETGRRIDFSPQVLKRFEEFGEMELRRTHPRQSEPVLSRADLERNLQRACTFEVTIFVNEDRSNIIDGFLVDQQDSDFEEIFEQIRQAAQSDEAWNKVSGFSLLAAALKEHPYFYLPE